GTNSAVVKTQNSTSGTAPISDPRPDAGASGKTLALDGKQPATNPNSGAVKTQNPTSGTVPAPDLKQDAGASGKTLAPDNKQRAPNANSASAKMQNSTSGTLPPSPQQAIGEAIKNVSSSPDSRQPNNNTQAAGLNTTVPAADKTTPSTPPESA